VLLVVADGLGGHRGGEIAAEILTASLQRAFQTVRQNVIARPSAFLAFAILRAHDEIRARGRAARPPIEPRSTCVACLVQNGYAYWAHVGDSRLYFVREGRIEGQTKDHSRVQLLVDAGRIREEAVAAHPDRNKIFNCLGQMNPPRVDLSRRTMLKQGDVILLCTDGLWGPLTGRNIVEGLLRADIMTAVPQLLDQAEMRSGKDGDNASAVAMAWAEDGDAVASDWISTQTMRPDDFKSTIEQFGRTVPPSAGGYLSDDEIERAIEEIRTAIKKHTR
jgi:serine/threonine protein phosphatase PrpC